MIVGCYALDLYCENYKSENDNIHEFNEFPHIYTHEKGSTCRKLARKDGWIIKEKENRAICPKCVKKKKGLKI